VSVPIPFREAEVKHLKYGHGWTGRRPPHVEPARIPGTEIRGCWLAVGGTAPQIARTVPFYVTVLDVDRVLQAEHNDQAWRARDARPVSRRRASTLAQVLLFPMPAHFNNWVADRGNNWCSQKIRRIVNPHSEFRGSQLVQERLELSFYSPGASRKRWIADSPRPTPMRIVRTTYSSSFRSPVLNSCQLNVKLKTTRQLSFGRGGDRFDPTWTSLSKARPAEDHLGSKESAQSFQRTARPGPQSRNVLN
jgi:hypothetical protein